MNTIDCNVLCVDSGSELLNLKGNDIWQPCRIDLRYVTKVKVAGLEEFDRCSVFFEDGDYWIIDIPYKSFLKLWDYKVKVTQCASPININSYDTGGINNYNHISTY